jgi:tetratricopeptide (TPR) repeat protein
VGNDSVRADTWDQLLKISITLYRTGEYDSAFSVGLRALEVAEQAYERTDSSVALILHRLGSFRHNFNRGEEDDAEYYYSQALRIWDSLPRPQPVNKAKTLSNYGLLLIQQARFDEANTRLHEALKLKQENLPAGDRSIAITMDKLGELNFELGNFVAAEELFLEALSTARNADSISYRSISASASGLGNLYYRWGRWVEAEKLWNEALDANLEEDNIEGLIGSTFYFTSESLT